MDVAIYGKVPALMLLVSFIFRAELEKHGHKVDQPEPMKS